MTQLLSIVLPAHNEQEVLPSTVDRLMAMRGRFRELDLDLEVVFVNDGSTDATGDLLDQLAGHWHNLRVIHFTRNFGHQAAVCAGLAVARGDVIAVMDSDLQDPPEVLPELIDKWRQGYQVVYAVREKRKEWFGKRFAYWAFYRLLQFISEIQMPLDSGDFCLMDRQTVDLMNSLPERQRFVRGLRSWVGLRQIGVRYERSARAGGTPSYSFRSLVKLALDGLVSFSATPLRMMTRAGLIGIAVAALIATWVVGATIYGWAQGSTPPRGWASLACLILVVSSIQMIFFGIIGEYLARIFLEVKGRPTYLIAKIVSNDRPVHEHASEQVVGAEEPQ